MKLKLAHKPRLMVLLVLWLIVVAGPVGALDWEGAVARASDTLDAQAVRDQLRVAKATAESAAFPGDPTWDVTPLYRKTALDAFAAAQSETVSLSSSVSWPLGLPEATRDKAELAALSLTSAERSLAWNLVSLQNKAFGLYATAWEAQEEGRLARQESSLLEAALEVAKVQFSRGTLTYTELRRSEEAVQTVLDATLMGERRLRVTRLELFSWLGLPDDGQPLSLALPASTSLPRAPELAMLAVGSDPSLADLALRAALYEDQARKRLEFSWTPTVKVTAAKDGLSASLGFVGDSQTLIASGEAPVAILAGNPSTALTLTASMTFSLSSGEADRQAATSLGLVADTQRLQKAAAAVKRDLDVRLAYQDWIRAVEAGRQATRTLALSLEILNTVQAKAKVGELSGPDFARAELDVAKAGLAVQTRAVDAERLLRNAALIAFYLLPDPKVSP